MIVGIGVDIVELERVERSWRRFGEKFAKKILSENEQARFADASDHVAWLAKRFAAKEAVSKALGTGMRAGVQFRQIEVQGKPGRAPTVELSGAARDRAAELGVTDALLSISDERHYAVAFAVLERA